jgi:hypothetical protein
MRNYTTLPAIALLALVTALPVMAADEEDTPTSILKSAGVKGGEVAAKLLAGLLYDTSCVNRNNDQFTGYVCTVLGSVSGRTEEKWKQEVTNQLKEINSKVDTLTVGQREIQRSLAEMKTDLNNRFNAVAQNVVAVQHLVKIEGLWEKYQAQFDKIDQDVSRDSMLSFAREIVAEKPHTMAGRVERRAHAGNPGNGRPAARPLSLVRMAHRALRRNGVRAEDDGGVRVRGEAVRRLPHARAEGVRDVSLGDQRAGVIVIGPDSGPIDWWVSKSGNTEYDEVHFAADWRNYIYSIPAAKAGPCSVSPNLPKGCVLPWVQPDRKVVEISGTEKPFAFGSFIAIQHAGGTYALVSGDWGGMTSPYFNKEGGRARDPGRPMDHRAQSAGRSAHRSLPEGAG